MCWIYRTSVTHNHSVYDNRSNQWFSCESGARKRLIRAWREPLPKFPSMPNCKEEGLFELYRIVTSTLTRCSSLSKFLAQRCYRIAETKKKQDMKSGDLQKVMIIFRKVGEQWTFDCLRVSNEAACFSDSREREPREGKREAPKTTKEEWKKGHSWRLICLVSWTRVNREFKQRRRPTRRLDFSKSWICLFPVGL